MFSSVVKNEPVEFEKEPVRLEFQDFRKVTNRFRGVYRICPNLIKNKKKTLTGVNMSVVGVGNTTRISTDYAHKIPRARLPMLVKGENYEHDSCGNCKRPEWNLVAHSVPKTKTKKGSKAIRIMEPGFFEPRNGAYDLANRIPYFGL